MYKRNVVLKEIMKRYKLKQGSKIDINLLEEISYKEKIEITDLRCMLQIDPKTMYCLRTGKRKYTLLKFNDYNQIKDKELLKKEKINYETFINLQNEMHLKPYTIIRILGISRYSYNKMKKGEILEVKIKNMKIKHIVDLITIDLKYKNRDKDGYCLTSKIKQLCKQRRISVKQFVKYYNINPRHMKFNNIAIKKSEKFYIGGNCKMSDDFIEDNYEKILNGLKKVANNVSVITGCKNYNEDLIQEAIQELYQKCGNIVKKFYFDMRIIFNILMSKAKYVMLNIYKKEYKEYNNLHYDSFEDGYIEHTNLFRDNRYNPELLI